MSRLLLALLLSASAAVHAENWIPFDAEDGTRIMVDSDSVTIAQSSTTIDGILMTGDGEPVVFSMAVFGCGRTGGGGIINGTVFMWAEKGTRLYDYAARTACIVRGVKARRK